MAYGWFRAEIVLSHREDLNTLEEQMVVASFSRPLGGGWSITGLAGVILGGTLQELPGEPYRPDAVRIEHTVSYGGVIGVALSKTWIPETATTPFLSTSFKLAAAYVPQVGSKATGDGMLAVDLRGSITVGKTFENVFTPYLSARAFGGPIVWWRRDGAAVGSDIYHVQIAIGASIHIPVGDSKVTATVDWSPALERSFSAGLSATF